MQGNNMAAIPTVHVIEMSPELKLYIDRAARRATAQNKIVVLIAALSVIVHIALVVL